MQHTATVCRKRTDLDPFVIDVPSTFQFIWFLLRFKQEELSTHPHVLKSSCAETSSCAKIERKPFLCLWDLGQSHILSTPNPSNQILSEKHNSHC